MANVTTYRYFRYRDEYFEHVEAKGGLTLRCELDYQANTITVYPAICLITDTFSKKIGRGLADKKKANNIYFSIPLKPGLSIRECIDSHFYEPHGLYKYWSDNTSKHFMDLFNHSWYYIL